jgi:hypothetical protein
MSNDLTRRSVALGLGASAFLPASALAQAQQTYSRDEILAAAQHFFGAGAEGLATVVDHVFEDLGRPNGYIEGNEGSGAIGVGLRYGDGYLRLKGRSGTTRVYWQGPAGEHLPSLSGRRWLGIFRRRRRRELSAARERHFGADARGRGAAAWRQYRLPRLFAAPAPQPVLIARA